MIQPIDLCPSVLAFTTQRGNVNPRNKYSEFNVCNYTGDDALHVLDSRMMLCMQLGIDMDSLIMPHQTHSCRVAVIDNKYMSLDIDKQENALDGVDALVTRLDNVCIGVNTADCVPLLLADPKARVIAAVHAGWRGTVAGIAARAIDTMVKQGAQPGNIIAVMGPAICQACFEVGDEVVEQFEKAGFEMDSILARDARTLKAHLDLLGANKQILKKSDLKENHIFTPCKCSRCNPATYFSARAQGINSGRTFTGIMLKK